jgi:hypothetical protein
VTEEMQLLVQRALGGIPIIDVHTHLFMPSLGALGLWGIDELVTYHYLEAELFRFNPITPEKYFVLSKREQADLIWRTLFVEHEPISEATRGVVAVLQALGLPTGDADLSVAREFFAAQTYNAHISRVFELAGINAAVMTNDPLDPAEAPLWQAGATPDARFWPALRLDRILNRWSEHWSLLAEQGYYVDEHASAASVAGVRHFLADWIEIMHPAYMACSLPDSFDFPEDSPRGRLLADAVLPACREARLPLSLMIGPRYQVNPRLRLAGDGAGEADLRALERILRGYPENMFLVSVLSRENQHELCVYARKFANLMPFGCWWFLNNPSVVEEITRERLEMLGTSFIPQHSDARVLEQLIYKWKNTRRTLAPILTNSYRLLAEDGREVTEKSIQSDVARLFRGNFTRTTGVVDEPITARNSR